MLATLLATDCCSSQRPCMDWYIADVATSPKHAAHRAPLDIEGEVEMGLAGERSHSQPARPALAPSRLGSTPLGAALTGASRTERNTYTMTSEEISVCQSLAYEAVLPCCSGSRIGIGRQT